MIKLLKLLWLWLDDHHLAWALRELNPAHPDVPHIFMRRVAVADQQRRLLR